ncbi:hypothetical protein AAVH_04775 [Aphelenchoides avenae]|nr:hypothetical protein AAVH_04775 [Aphelenchus avenae]
MGQDEELFLHEAAAESTSRMTLEKILAGFKEKIAIREDQIPELEERTDCWAKFEGKMQKSEADVERRVKRLLDHIPGDERVEDKMDKVASDIYVQTRGLKNIKEAEQQNTKENKATARTAEILKAMKAENAKLASTLDAVAASLDKTMEKIDGQMDAVCSFAASMGIDKESITQLLAQVSSSAHGTLIAQ